MKRTFSLSFVICTFFCFSSSYAGNFILRQSHSSARNQHLVCDQTMDLTGSSIIGTEHVYIQANQLKGDKHSIIKGHTITIQTNQFLYNGTIECDGECIIITPTPIDFRCFKQKGTGRFIHQLTGCRGA